MSRLPEIGHTSVCDARASDLVWTLREDPPAEGKLLFPSARGSPGDPTGEKEK